MCARLLQMTAQSFRRDRSQDGETYQLHRADVGEQWVVRSSLFLRSVASRHSQLGPARPPLHFSA